MKVLQLHAGYRTPAGEDTVVEAEARALRRGGHEVEQAIEHNPATTVAALRALARSRYNRVTAAHVSELCDTIRPDIAHVHNTWFAQSSSVIDAVVDAGLPTVMTIHNYRLSCLGVDLFRDNAICTSCVGRSPVAGIVHRCYRDSFALSAVMAVEVMSTRRRRTLERIDRFVAPSAFMADRLVDIGVPADRLTVKPHFTPDPGPRASSPSTSNDVLFIGRLASAKGIRTLLRAWERHASGASREASARRLTIVGDGPLAAEAHESAPRGVEFAGWLSHAEVQRRMRGARAFVFPSEWYEPFGMVLIEAMAAGTPVVATTASDAAQITGTPARLVAPAGDERALAACLDELDDATVDEAGRIARRRFEEMYSEDIGLEALVDLYGSVIEGRRRP
ncbi:glycosyltransferase family 4 protein [Ilumatobacter sp.]|uniref:glycosyltransferase family 4 protein n=3 Tax=Ilumatobacter sp. TaxID=1967498 RepID=UPI003299B526